jgi:hypothetical protein
LTEEIKKVLEEKTIEKNKIEKEYDELKEQFETLKESQIRSHKLNEESQRVIDEY